METKKVTLPLDSGDEEGVLEVVINGCITRIRRGVPVDLPMNIYRVLKMGGHLR